MVNYNPTMSRRKSEGREKSIAEGVLHTIREEEANKALTSETDWKVATNTDSILDRGGNFGGCDTPGSEVATW